MRDAPSVKKTLWQCEQQVEATIRQLQGVIAGMKKTLASKQSVEDAEMALHHLKNTVIDLQGERARRRKARGLRGELPRNTTFAVDKAISSC